MAIVALSPEDKSLVRYHMGYPDIDTAQYLLGGVTFSVPTQFLLENQMNQVRDTAVPRIQQLTGILETIEQQMVDALGRLRAVKADVVTLNPTEHLDLEVQYKRWQNKLAMILNAYVNPSSNGGVYGINARMV